jgi:beta-glucosidase-like glycosyl hydrolase
MGAENRIKGVNVALAPVGGALGRAPAAGRNWEAFGADPYLTGIANAESVKGLQDEGVIACAKHWIANEQEHFRLVIESLTYGPIFKSMDSQVSQRVLRELYEWPFFDAVEAGAGSVMCSYQRVNEEYACESTTIIRDHLKSSSTGLGFRGFVVTDWFASAAPDAAADAGVDMVMPGDLGLTGTAAATKEASDGALATGTRLDEMATRIVAAWYKMRQDQAFLGNVSFSSWNPDDEFGVWLDRGYVGQINFHVPANSSLHSTVARRVAAEGAVLLKNIGGALPLGDGTKKVAVFGNDAGPIKKDCGDFGACEDGTLAVGWGSGSGLVDNIIDVSSILLSCAAIYLTQQALISHNGASHLSRWRG